MLQGQNCTPNNTQAIERELGQPFFAWLSERKGTDGHALGAAGAMRIASPQTAEDFGAAPRIRRHLHRREIPGPRRTGPGVGRRRGGIRRRGGQVARRLRPRNCGGLWRLVRRGARPGCCGRHAPSGRDRSGGCPGTRRNRDRPDHARRGARRPADRHEAGDRGGRRTGRLASRAMPAAARPPC